MDQSALTTRRASRSGGHFELIDRFDRRWPHSLFLVAAHARMHASTSHTRAAFDCSPLRPAYLALVAVGAARAHDADERSTSPRGARPSSRLPDLRWEEEAATHELNRSINHAIKQSINRLTSPTPLPHHHTTATAPARRINHASRQAPGPGPAAGRVPPPHR